MILDLGSFVETRGDGEIWTAIVTSDPADSCVESTLVAFRTINDKVGGRLHFASPLAPGLTTTLPASPFTTGVFPLILVGWQQTDDHMVLSGGQVMFVGEENGQVAFTLSDTKLCPIDGPAEEMDLDACISAPEGTLTFVGRMGAEKEPWVGTPGWDVTLGEETRPLCVFPNP